MFDVLCVMQSRQARSEESALGMPGVSRWWSSIRTIMHAQRQSLPDKIPFRLRQFPPFCGQSRTTIRARNFAALIGRFRVGDN
jgi:hypothetical protein